MSPKSIGLVVVFAGICVMIATASSVFSVFTGKQPPIQLFHLPPLKINPASFMPSLPGGISLPGSGSAATVELYPADAISFMANVTAHLFLAGFFLNVGYKLASLGVQLIAADKSGRTASSPEQLPVALRPNPPIIPR